MCNFNLQKENKNKNECKSTSRTRSNRSLKLQLFRARACQTKKHHRQQQRYDETKRNDQHYHTQKINLHAKSCNCIFFSTLAVLDIYAHICTNCQLGVENYAVLLAILVGVCVVVDVANSFSFFFVNCFSVASNKNNKLTHKINDA